jgi:hypothetical protein
MSNWHFSAYEEVAKYWVENGDTLTQTEINALKNLRSIFKKYTFGEKYIGKYFIDYEEQDTFRALEKSINKKDFELIINVFEIFRNRLEKLWAQDRERLVTIEKSLLEIVISDRFQAPLNTIDKIFGKTKDFLVVKLFVLPKSFGHIGGSANTKIFNVTLELRDENDCKSGILVVLHEYLHNLLKKKGISFRTRRIIKKDIKENIDYFTYMTKEETIEELFISSFLPDGYLSYKFAKDIQIDKNIKALPDSCVKIIKELINTERCITQKEVNAFVRCITE